MGPRLKFPLTHVYLNIVRDPDPASTTPIGKDPDLVRPTPVKLQQAGRTASGPLSSTTGKGAWSEVPQPITGAVGVVRGPL